MNNVFGLAVFGLGVSLLIVAFAASEPAGVQLSRWVAAYPALQSAWLLVLGVLAVLAGLGLAFWGARKH